MQPESHSWLQGKYCVKGQGGFCQWLDLTGVDWLQADQIPNQDLFIRQLVGHSVSVWWPGEHKHFKGTVTGYMPNKVSCCCQFENGTLLAYDLYAVTLTYLRNAAELCCSNRHLWYAASMLPITHLLPGSPD